MQVGDWGDWEGAAGKGRQDLQEQQKNAEYSWDILEILEVKKHNRNSDLWNQGIQWMDIWQHPLHATFQQKFTEHSPLVHLLVLVKGEDNWQFAVGIKLSEETPAVLTLNMK